VRERALIHVGGPKGAGKTTFVAQIGIERAQLAVVNARDDRERERGERLVSDVHRLRKDAAVFDDMLGYRGSKIPVTAVVANVADRSDAGTKKALARVRRAIRGRG